MNVKSPMQGVGPSLHRLPIESFEEAPMYPMDRIQQGHDRQINLLEN
ncbi:hypothetical protein EK56_004029, partial [Salmonella enterica subsp. enterica]|nr:hypothetical protein [Salmonella enterica subsp. enterica serovar Abony]